MGLSFQSMVDGPPRKQKSEAYIRQKGTSKP
jgi:hypothetical protein